MEKSVLFIGFVFVVLFALGSIVFNFREEERGSSGMQITASLNEVIDERDNAVQKKVFVPAPNEIELPVDYEENAREYAQEERKSCMKYFDEYFEENKAVLCNREFNNR